MGRKNWVSFWGKTTDIVKNLKSKNSLSKEEYSKRVESFRKETKSVTSWILRFKWEKAKPVLMTKTWEIVLDKDLLKWAKSWDLVSVEVVEFKNSKRWKIIEILKQKARYAVWIMAFWEITVWWNKVKVEDWLYNMFKHSNYNWAVKLQEVWVENNQITYKVVWKADKKWINSDFRANIVLNNGFDIDFKKETLKEANSIKFWEAELEKELKKRRDLRSMYTFTIDWKSSKDFDDAISIEELDDWTTNLYVHIADVTHFVKEWTSLDNEALERWTSVYYSDMVTPMLPEILSNWLCSLNPWEAKLTVTCKMNFDKNWKINHKKSEIFESVIKSDYRLTYEDAQLMQDWKLKEKWDLFTWDKVTTKLIDKMNKSFALAKILNQNRADDWELLFKFDEYKTKYWETKEILWFEKYPSFDSNDMIKAFMVEANCFVSEEFNSRQIPFVYRVHEQPSQDKIKDLEKLLLFKWINTEGLEFTYEWIPWILERISTSPYNHMLSKKVLQSLKLANYSTKPLWHFWLAAEYYSHFTSPIRRYADLQIHRIIKEVINKSPYLDKVVEKYEKWLDDVCNNINNQEKFSEDIESNIFRKEKCMYYDKKLKNNETNELFVEAYISLIDGKKIILDTESWSNLELIMDWEFQIVENEDYKINELYKWEKTYSVCDKVKVKIEKVDLIDDKIYAKLYS